MAGKPGGDPDANEHRAKPFDQVSKALNVWKDGVGKFFTKLIPGKKNDVKYFRRLICCKLKELHKMDSVIDALLALGFTDITNEEVIGRRGSRSMLQYVLDDKVHRLHVRAHVIDNTGYLLVHKEPLPSVNVDDLYFHVRGFFERVGRQVNSFFTRIASDPQKVTVNYNERAELSDYEQGCHLFRELVKEKDPGLYQSLDFYLDDHDFLAFSLKFGEVGKVLPIEFLIMDFNKNVESSNLQGLSRNICAMLDMIGFPSMDKISIKSKLAFIKAFPSLEKEMESVIESLLHENHSGKLSLACIFAKNALHAEFIANYTSFIQIQPRIHVLIVVQDSGGAVVGQQDVKKLRKKDIYASQIDLNGFKALFERFLNTPFSAEDFLVILRENELITVETVAGLSRQKMDKQQASKILLDVLDYLGKNPGWHQTKELKRDLMKKDEFSSVSESNLDHVFDFLKNPLLELVKTRKDGKELSGIENKEEFKLKLSNMKKILGSIDI